MSPLDFLVSPAFAQSSASPAGGMGGLALTFGLMAVMFYFMLIRPQMRRNKEQRTMLDSLAKGDEAVINGGIAGRIVSIGENYISLEISEGVQVKVQKGAIASVLPKGTLKTL